MDLELRQGAERMAKDEERGGTKFEVSVASSDLLFVSASAPLVWKLFLFLMS